MVNDAVILAGGNGSRMKLYNHSLIKPLVEVKGKALIGYTIEALHLAGVKNIHIIANNYEDLSILKEMYSNVNIDIHVSNGVMGAVGAVYRVSKFIHAPFVLARKFFE